jgi:hypothetical protein
VTFTFLTGTEADHRPIGTLEVHYEKGLARRVSSVRLELDGGLTPVGLQRFSWAKWFALADTLIHTPPPPTVDLMDTDDAADYDAWVASVSRAGTSAVRNVKGLRDAKRPGRGGHPEHFYRGIAKRYRELVADNVRNPVKTIAEELGEYPETVSRWVRKCRPPYRDLLPPARQGRAG